MRKYKKIELGTTTREMFEFEESNEKGEKITIEISECHASKEQQKIGFPAHWLSVQTYAETAEYCSGKYDPFTLIEEFTDNNGRRCCYRRVDVANILPVSEENKKICLEMVERLAF